ncbi:MAG: DUF1993 domain-containing protein [Pseudomonadota bacterium]|nr:DUF1993 domain-containing protein [Pseudomonadota bacterium]
MPLSMYDASVPAFVNMLTSISKILDKAAAHADAKKIDPSVLINDRLAPDMFPLSRQIQIATDGVKGGAARLAGVDVPSYPDTETTFAELKARIDKTVAFLHSIDKAKFDGAEDRSVTMKVGPNDMTFPAKVYLFEFVIPNFYFHATTTYAILRHNGIEMGKQDFLAGLAPYFGR